MAGTTSYVNRSPSADSRLQSLCTAAESAQTALDASDFFYFIETVNSVDRSMCRPNSVQWYGIHHVGETFWQLFKYGKRRRFFNTNHLL